MLPLPDRGKFRAKRRTTLELGMTPLIDIVFLLLIFFMLTSRFIVHEGIQVDLPATAQPHPREAVRAHRITVTAQGDLIVGGRSMSLTGLKGYLDGQDTAYLKTTFEIVADRQASIQTVVTIMEILREKGASAVTLATERIYPNKAPDDGDQQ